MPRINLDDLINKEPRRAVRWVQDHLSDVPRLAERGGHDAVEWVHARLPSRRELKSRGEAVSHRAEGAGRDAVEWVQAHLPSRRDLRELQRRAPDAGALLWPTVIAAAGAGAAFWWWTSWSRGRAEAERAAAEGAANPETVMAHAPPPPDVEPAPRDPHPAEDADVPDVMAHAPPPPAKGKLKKVKPVVAPKAEAALRRSLAVQAAGDAPPKRKPPREPKATA